MLLRRRMMGGGGEVPFEEQYLTFEALESGTFTLTIPSGVSTTNLTSVSYSLDGGSTWTTTNNVDSTEVVITTPSVAYGDKVLWKGNARATCSTSDVAVQSVFSATGAFNACGNIMSLLYGDTFIGKVSLDYVNTFCGLFKNNTHIIDASNMLIPAATLSISCYREMFYGCTSLTTPPYEIPATTAKNDCCRDMFYGCISLTTAPILHPKTLATRSYMQMFTTCSVLTYIKCLATTTGSSSAYQWLYKASATGTFVKDANATFWQSGVGGIPSGWTVIDA